MCVVASSRRSVLLVIFSRMSQVTESLEEAMYVLVRSFCLFATVLYICLFGLLFCGTTSCYEVGSWWDLIKSLPLCILQIASMHPLLSSPSIVISLVHNKAEGSGRNPSSEEFFGRSEMLCTVTGTINILFDSSFHTLYVWHVFDLTPAEAIYFDMSSTLSKFHLTQL